MQKKTTAKPDRKRVPATGLSGYLVIWRHTMDDIPIGFFASKAEARKFAKTIDFADAYARARKMELDCSSPVCFAICTFRNGLSTQFEFVERADDA